MKPHHLLPRLSWLGAASLLLFWGSASSSGPFAAEPKLKAKTYRSADFVFTNQEVPRIEIEIPEKDVATLRRYEWRGFQGEEQKRPAVKATVRDGAATYRDVSVHLKGAAGSFRSIDDEPALTLNFDKHVPGQTFHGLERFSLNNSVQDRSLLNEQVCREIFLAAGVPVPRAGHTLVKLNGRDLGVYVLTEAFNKQYLAQHFKNPGGNLYDGGFLRDVTDNLVKSSGPKPDDRADLKKLADAAREPDATKRLARLAEVLDLDRFITYLALDLMMCNWDGYAINKNNYRVYQDLDSGKIVFMPHGLDQMFGVMRAGTDMPLFPKRWSGLVARAVMQTPEGKQRYRERVEQLAKSQFNAQVLTNRVWQLAAKIEPAVAKGGPGAVRSHQREVRDFCERILDRCRFIQEQLVAPEKVVKFDTQGVVRLSGWQPRTESGKPALAETAEAARKLLQISAPGGSCVGVWSTRVALEPGRYRIEGRAKSRGIVPDPGDRRGGAGLRIGGRRLTQKLLGDSAWTEVSFEFDLQESTGDPGFMGPIESENPDVEILCELRAAKGEVWFDKDSLVIRRR